MTIMKGSCTHLPLGLPLTWKVTAPMLWLLPILTILAEASNWPGKVFLLILRWEGTWSIAFFVVSRIRTLLLMLRPCWVCQTWNACLIRHPAISCWGQLHWGWLIIS